MNNLERLQEQLQETKTCCLVCDTFNVDQGLNLKGQVDSLKNIILIGDDSHEDVITVQSLLLTPGDKKYQQTKFDWDKEPICLMYTTRYS